MTPRSDERVLYVDLLRAYAIFLVIFTHVAAPIFNGIKTTPPLTWGLFNVLNAIVRVCVPLFIMVSGKLLISSNREEPPLDYLRRRLPPIVIPFAAWSLIYAMVNAHFERQSLSLAEAFRLFLQGPTEYHLWFMYMMVGIFLVAPFLRRFARAARPEELAYILGLWFVFITLQYAVPSIYDNEGPAGTLISFGGYFLLGYALDQRAVSKRMMKGLVSLALLIVATTSVAAYGMTRAGGYPELHYFGYLYPLVVIHASAVFLIFKGIDWGPIFERRPRLLKAARYLSAETFNLYLIHLMLITLFVDRHLGFRLWERTGGKAWIGVPLEFTAVTLGTLAVSALLQKIPGVSRVLVIRFDRVSKK